jgi:hypothetical protein
MIVVPLSQPKNESNEWKPVPRAREAEPLNVIRIAASGTLLAGGLLLLTGHRRAGLAASASGVALALLDQQEVVHCWWNLLPGYIDDLQRLLGQVQDVVEGLGAQRETLRRVLAR